jgi:diguanylate cyclase (GGDEF)-like protein
MTTTASRWNLTRYFSVTSLLGVVVVTACLIGIYRELSERHLVAHESRANADITHVFANAVWRQHAAYVLGSQGRDRESLLANPALRDLSADVAAKMQGSRVVKVKIYNTDGLTVFSTDARQIGEDKSSNAGFLSARDGVVASMMTHRDRFDAFEGVIENRDLIASYVPVRREPQRAPDAVLEIYSDVTPLLAAQRRAQWQIAGIVVSMLALLYLFLHIVVRRADRTITAHEAERSAHEARVRHQAYHDALTGLPNRSYFGERLKETVALAARHGHIGALLYIDLDRFKIVNDSLGHDAGDLVLKAAGERIAACLRTTDLLFRMGGDEFTVILPHIDVPDGAAHAAQRIIAAVSRPVSVYGHDLVVGATIGIAVFPGDGQNTESLVKNADAAMYTAKQAGRNRHAFYQAAMNARSMQRLDLQMSLQKAFVDGEFELHYQPRLDARTLRVVAAEALLRWHSPQRGLVLPGEFIGVLEDLNMMPIVGEWVLRTACAQWMAWRAQGARLDRVSVNVSARQFEGGKFAATVARVLQETGVPGAAVELELTESMLLTDVVSARETLAALRELGVRLSIDDFGTGYSSLGYLRELNVDYLKIDRRFVTEVVGNARDQAVATAIGRLAAALGMTAVAEGVETDAQAEFFTDIGCGELQGFLFSRPVPAAVLQAMVLQAAAARLAVTTSPALL